MVSRVATTRSVCEASTIALLIQIGKPKLESDLKPVYVGVSHVHRGGCGSADTTSRQLNLTRCIRCDTMDTFLEVKHNWLCNWFWSSRLWVRIPPPLRITSLAT